jgi:hypothetical protein
MRGAEISLVERVAQVLWDIEEQAAGLEYEGRNRPWHDGAQWEQENFIWRATRVLDTIWGLFPGGTDYARILGELWETNQQAARVIFTALQLRPKDPQESGE